MTNEYYRLLAENAALKKQVEVLTELYKLEKEKNDAQYIRKHSRLDLNDPKIKKMYEAGVILWDLKIT